MTDQIDAFLATNPPKDEVLGAAHYESIHPLLPTEQRAKLFAARDRIVALYHLKPDEVATK